MVGWNWNYFGKRDEGTSFVVAVGIIGHCIGTCCAVMHNRIVVYVVTLSQFCSVRFFSIKVYSVFYTPCLHFLALVSPSSEKFCGTSSSLLHSPSLLKYHETSFWIQGIFILGQTQECTHQTRRNNHILAHRTWTIRPESNHIQKQSWRRVCCGGWDWADSDFFYGIFLAWNWEGPRACTQVCIIRETQCNTHTQRSTHASTCITCNTHTQHHSTIPLTKSASQRVHSLQCALTISHNHSPKHKSTLLQYSV